MCEKGRTISNETFGLNSTCDSLEKYVLINNFPSKDANFSPKKKDQEAI